MDNHTTYSTHHIIRFIQKEGTTQELQILLTNHFKQTTQEEALSINRMYGEKASDSRSIYSVKPHHTTVLVLLSDPSTKKGCKKEYKFYFPTTLSSTSWIEPHNTTRLNGEKSSYSPSSVYRHTALQRSSYYQTKEGAILGLQIVLSTYRSTQKQFSTKHLLANEKKSLDEGYEGYFLSPFCIKCCLISK